LVAKGIVDDKFAFPTLHQASQPIFFPTTDLYMLLICAKNISLQRQKKGVAKGVVYDKKGVVN
jgi:hypothetical protein